MPNTIKCKDCYWWYAKEKRCQYNAYSGYTSKNFSCNRAEEKTVIDNKEKIHTVLSQTLK